MIANQALINQSKPGSGNEPTNMQRRTLIGGALVALLSAPGRVMAQEKAVPNDSFVVLLKGVYEPVVHGPNLGLSEVNLSDGSYSITKIYPVNGIPGNTNPNKAVGDFYVQFSGDLCAYHVPGGSFAMRFTGGGFTEFEPDGLGGTYLIGTFELTILEATGIYQSFVGGHNHMVDKLHQLANGSFDEYCFCFISRT
ncbi:MAG TPA: hypothetical protein VK746_15015 [Candidatus Eisenbacteria bacterium]|nr:hypothetical protein [Candidatus Eisenbacteria bacterium]